MASIVTADTLLSASSVLLTPAGNLLPGPSQGRNEDKRWKRVGPPSPSLEKVQEVFRCCGLSSEGHMDWAKNEYFNCTSPSVERCGVPFSCCMNATDISVSTLGSHVETKHINNCLRTPR
uniref:Uncharacterized protein n=1 Tax=Timema douglasi TaxID=61478 RepID=A0A7R8VB03_TIMDO|nr:unnamed protein product [Timema douglasi]